MKKLIAISSVLAMLATVTPALADGYDYHHSSGTTVSNYNSAYVTNAVNTSANTGSNQANGSNSNTATVSGSGNKNAAVAGSGGYIETGNAVAGSQVGNIVNSNYTSVNNCGCSSEHSKGVTVTNKNSWTHVSNTVNTSAYTGSNVANGGTGNSATVGSDKSSGDSNQAIAGSGGSIYTGNAHSYGSVANVVNSTITRIY